MKNWKDFYWRRSFYRRLSIFKPNFSTAEFSILEISTQGPSVSFLQDDSMRNVLGFDSAVLYDKYNLSPNPVEILSFDNIFLETDVAQGLIFQGKRTGIFIILQWMWILGISKLNLSEEEFNGIWWRVKTLFQISALS